MKRFTEHRQPWGKFLDIKINVKEVLEKDLEKLGAAQLNLIKKEIKWVFLSSVTDPYQLIERKYKLTRKCLQILLEHQIPVSILTKSDLVLRDLHLLKQFEYLEVGLSTGIADDQISSKFEPGAPSLSKRIAALDILHKKGIATYGFISPIFPYLTDLPKLLEILSDKVDYIMLESLNTKPSSWIGVERVLEKYFPELLPKYKKIFFTPQKGEYLNQLQKEIDNLSKKYKIKASLFTH
jgi:DNA repair photolyase